VQSSNRRASGDKDVEVAYQVWNFPKSPRAVCGRRVASGSDTAFRTLAPCLGSRRIRTARFSGPRERAAERAAFVWKFANPSPLEMNSTYIELRRQSRV
jgi:hypothetical protein